MYNLSVNLGGLATGMNMSLAAPKESRPRNNVLNEMHGVLIWVGATGSGKSAAVVTCIHGFANAICRACPPGGYSDCYEVGGLRYIIKRNAKSPKMDPYSELMVDTANLDEPGYHVVAFLDEGQLNANARRSSSGENLAWGEVGAQGRKGGNFIHVSTQTLRKIDVILREDAKAILQCWNPFRHGRITYVMVHPGADAALPPWESPPPFIITLPTYRAFGLYDSWEKFDPESARAMLAESPSVIWRNQQTGEPQAVPVYSAVEWVMTKATQANMRTISYFDVMDTIVEKSEDIGELHPRHVRDALRMQEYKMQGGVYVVDEAA